MKKSFQLTGREKNIGFYNSINCDSKKTPYSVWAYSDKNSLKYNSKWNKKTLDDLSRNEKSFLSSDLELEEAKKVAYVPFNESTLDMQKITIETDSDLRPCFSILTAYRDIESTSFFALEMQYIYDNDIVPEKNESWSPFLSVEETLKLDLKNSDYNSIEKYLGERIEGFKDAGFKVETIIPANANYYYIDSFVDGILKMYFYRLEQKSHMVFGFDELSSQVRHFV